MCKVSPMEQQGRILIVDDNATCVDVFRRVLHKEYRLDVVSSGDE